MRTYIFNHNGETINEEINMILIEENNISRRKIGNIYNLVDYINYNIEDNSKIRLINFTGNKINFIIKAITKYRNITRVDEYYSLIINSKKRRIRGR